MSDRSNRYAPYRLLFSNNIDDKRVDLFLSLIDEDRFSLHQPEFQPENFINNKSVDVTIQSNKTVVFNVVSALFGDKEKEKKFNIPVEWLNFFNCITNLSNLANRNTQIRSLVMKVSKKQLDNKILKLINTLGVNTNATSIVNQQYNLKEVFPAEIINAIDTQGKCTKNVTDFGFNYNKFWLNKLLSSEADTKLPVGKSDFFNDVPDCDDKDGKDGNDDNNKYWRKADGSLWTIRNGKEEQVDRNSEAYKLLTIDNKCLGTGFVGDANVKCGDYLRDCLNGKGVEKCKDFLSKSDYWENAVNEVNAMLPPIALKTLHDFEFDTVEVYDETNKRNIKKVVDTTAWLASIKSKVNDNVAHEAISKNTKLIGYLDMLVNKVNSNPAILNKDITRSDEQRVYNPNAFRGTKLASFGLKPRLAVSTLAPSSVERLSTLVGSTQDALKVRLFAPALLGNLGGVIGMHGGASPLEALEERLSADNKQTWSVLKSNYLALLQQLQALNKDIAQGDKDKIDRLFDQLQKSEVKLMQVLLMTEKYNKLITVHGEKDNNSVLTIDHLKDFVDQRNKYFTRVAKKQNDLISIIKSIADALQQQTQQAKVVVSGTPSPLSLAGLLG